MAKFSSKAITIYAAVQSAEGVPATVTEANAIATLNLNFSTEISSETVEYTGDELSRDEEVIEKDTFGQFDFETLMPKLGTIAGGTPTMNEVPLQQLFRACGLGVVLTVGQAELTNSVVSNEFLTVEIRRSSSDIATDKVYKLVDCRGYVDFDGQVGSKAKLKFNFMGNIASVTQETAFVADFGSQKLNTATVLKSSDIRLSGLVLYSTASEPADPVSSNVCFSKLVAPNLSGFSYDRYMTSCAENWSKEAAASDVTLTILEDAADATYNPSAHIADSHKLVVNYGNGTGEEVDMTFTKLILSNVVSSEIAKYVGQDLPFRNTGKVSIKLS